MYIKDLIKKLQDYPQDSQIFLASDSEGNEIKTIDCIIHQDFDKTNNDGTYEAIVIYPTDTTIE